jgi:hypothetical protein
MARTAADRIRLAWMSGIARRHCARGVIDDLDAALAELRETAEGRADLLAEHAGVSLGIAEAGIDIMAPIYRAEAKLCIAAGADESAISAWIEVGRKRAESARAVPFTGVSDGRGSVQR